MSHARLADESQERGSPRSNLFERTEIESAHALLRKESWYGRFCLLKIKPADQPAGDNDCLLVAPECHDDLLIEVLELGFQGGGLFFVSAMRK